MNTANFILFLVITIPALISQIAISFLGKHRTFYGKEPCFWETMVMWLAAALAATVLTVVSFFIIGAIGYKKLADVPAWTWEIATGVWFIITIIAIPLHFWVKRKYSRIYRDTQVMPIPR